ncbi:MAG: methyl-viologen-reducing hydrogenase subunit delta [Thermoplasmata archaeon]|nr:MAG: methyl-viologen-reducing hydrogenase subunit delta [Thermoplasmata archaeon]
MNYKNFEPKIIAFLCNWCAYAGADMAGTSRLKYPANVVPIKVMCSGRIDPEFVIDAFEKGADGVFIGGCHPGDCHYVNGNIRTRRRVAMMKKLLEQMGINPRRLRLEWISATEGAKFAKVMEEFVNEIREIGPLRRK